MLGQICSYNQNTLKFHNRREHEKSEQEVKRQRVVPEFNVFAIPFWIVKSSIVTNVFTAFIAPVSEYRLISCFLKLYCEEL